MSFKVGDRVTWSRSPQYGVGTVLNVPEDYYCETNYVTVRFDYYTGYDDSRGSLDFHNVPVSDLTLDSGPIEAEFKAGDCVRLTGTYWARSEGYTFPEYVKLEEGRRAWWHQKQLGFYAGGVFHYVYPDGPEEAELVHRPGGEPGRDAGDHQETPFEQNVRRILLDVEDLLIRKNEAYGNSALDPVRVFSKADRTEQLKVRIDDKIKRIQNGDTSEDSVTDLIGYLVLMKIAEESE